MSHRPGRVWPGAVTGNDGFLGTPGQLGFASTSTDLGRRRSGPGLAAQTTFILLTSCGTTAGNSGGPIEPVRVTVIGKTPSDRGRSRVSVRENWRVRCVDLIKAAQDAIAR
jgi:hypothetical protein